MKMVQVLTAALMLAVPVFAVWAVGPQANRTSKELPPVDVAVLNPAAVSSAAVKASKTGELPAEVMAREWTSTSGGKRPKPSPKG